MISSHYTGLAEISGNGEGESVGLSVTEDFAYWKVSAESPPGFGWLEKLKTFSERPQVIGTVASVSRCFKDGDGAGCVSDGG